MEYNKLRGLVMAQRAGFLIPETYASNDYNRFQDKAAYIAKPIAGGAATRLLDDGENDPRVPVFVQEKLLYPELRIFRAGPHYFGFGIDSKTLDSRDDRNQAVTVESVPEHLRTAMAALTDMMGLDYAAADFKTCPRGRGFLFLEINTMPFLTGYDDAVSGRLSDAVLLTLTKLAGR
jgi:glutathione synthase/RimK-type ligase-like ATP-grasp enzyme